MSLVQANLAGYETTRRGIRDDFPVLTTSDDRGDTPRTVYLDNAATTLKPRSVIQAVVDFYERSTANVARGDHRTAEAVTMLFEEARSKVAALLTAKPHEITFTSGCTDAINLVAVSLDLGPEDEVVVSSLEHHSNLLPWRMRATVRTVATDPQGMVDQDMLKAVLSGGTRVKLVAVTGLSNVTGNPQPVADIIRTAVRYGVPTLIDAAQLVGHSPIDVTALGCDYLAFSGHKMLGPSGVGVLYIREDRLPGTKPARFGGGMVNKVEPDRVLLHSGPAGLEAGTPNIEGVLGLGAAVAYLERLGMPTVHALLTDLERYAWERLSQIEAITFPFPRGPGHAPIFAFRPRNPDCDPRYIGRILSDAHGVALNVGYQCAQPLYQSAQVAGAMRASFYVYNDRADVDVLADALRDLAPFLG